MSPQAHRPSSAALLALFAVTLAGLGAAAGCTQELAPLPRHTASPSPSAAPAAPAPSPVVSNDSGTPVVDPDAGVPAAADAGPGDAASIEDAQSASLITSLTLLDTSLTGIIAGSPIAAYDPLKNGTTLSAAVVGTQLSVRANIASAIGSADFDLDGTKHTENAAPYALCGDNGAGTITNCNITIGSHTLTVTPYTDANLGGTAGVPRTVTFTLTP